MFESFSDSVLLLSAITSSVSAAIAVAVLGMHANRRRIAAKATAEPAPVVYLFDGQDLVDANPRADELLAFGQGEGSDWSRLMSALEVQYPDVRRSLQSLDAETVIEIGSRDGLSRLIALATGDRIRISLHENEPTMRGVTLDTPVFRSMLRELQMLRAVSDEVPFPLWLEDESATVVWKNLAFQAFEARQPERGRDALPFRRDALPDVASGETQKRIWQVPTGGEDARPFDCRAAALGDLTLYSAIGIEATVAAETQLRDFMQTLTKTFSYLTSGLAIFDRERRLTLFNPALTDLTGLPVEFLAGRPSLFSVLDRLRERRMIPEPKDYPSWRRRIATLETAASDGTYSETWQLPDNRIFRVTGRPHPEGAVAFLLEDISAEISLTRKFRSELELGQAVLDTLEEAIAVFASDGTLSLVNTAYHDLWETDIGDRIDVPTVVDASRQWMARSSATPVWGEIRDFVLNARERGAWTDVARLSDGAELFCRVLPLIGGSTLVGFSREPFRSLDRIPETATA